MTVRYNEARANSSCDNDHKLGALLNYFLMPENMGVSLENIIGWVVAENVEALEVCLVKSRKLLKEASKTQTKLLTRIAKQKLALEKGHPTKVAPEEAARVLSQTTEQLDWVRATVTNKLWTLPISRFCLSTASPRMKNPVPQGRVLPQSQG